MSIVSYIHVSESLCRHVVSGGVLINNLVVLLFFLHKSCYVWGRVGWGGVITCWYANVFSCSLARNMVNTCATLHHVLLLST